MLRREFFNWLGGLPFCGFLKKEENREWKNDSIKYLTPIVGELKSIRRPKLRLWQLPVNAQHIEIQKLANIISEWDKESDLDLIWTGPIYVQQFDICDSDQDIVLQPGDAKVEDIKVGDDGKMTARIICKEPFIRIVNDSDKNE